MRINQSRLSTTYSGLISLISVGLFFIFKDILSVNNILLLLTLTITRLFSVHYLTKYRLYPFLFITTYFDINAVATPFLFNSINSDIFNLLFIESLLSHFFPLILLFPIKDLKFKFSYKYNTSLNKLFILTLSALLFSLLSYHLGITRMSTIHNTLPYKLEPLLNITRNSILPLFFLVFIYSFQGSRRRVILSILLYSAWTALEAYIRYSRGVIFFNLIFILPLILKKLTWRRFCITSVIAILSISSFFIIGFARRNNHKSITSIPTKTAIFEVTGRFFGDIKVLTKIVDFKKTSKYDRDKILEQGAVKFHTEQIDSSDFKSHSSGITLLTESLLYGGVHYLLLSFLLIFILASSIQLLFGNTIAFAPLYYYSFFYLYERICWGDGALTYFSTRSIFTIFSFPGGLALAFILLYKKSRDIKQGDKLN